VFSEWQNSRETVVAYHFNNSGGGNLSNTHGGFIILFRASDSKTRESLQGDHRDENGTQAVREK